MGSRSLRSRSLHEPLSGWPRTLLAKVKQQRWALPAFLKSGVGGTFQKSSGKRRLIRRASRAVVWGSGGRGDPDGHEGLQRDHVRQGLPRWPW
jgi:hypothetical protein